MTMKSLTTGDTIRSSLHRQRVSFNVELTGQEEEMGSVKDADPLPIVELKPFVQKVWRRERSFASTWERSPSVATVKSEKSESAVSKTKDAETMSTITLESGPEDASISPPPRTSHSLPSRLTERFLTVYVNAFDDFKTQKEHFHRFVGESGFKTKTRLHPVVDTKSKKQPEHSVNIIPGFITRDDRTKTTLNEISEGDSTSRFYSCSPKAIGPDDIRKQQQLRVSGEKMDQQRRSSPGPQNNSPAPSRSMNGCWHAANIRHGSPASMLYHNKRDSKAKRTKTPLYDHLDRTGSLPSLSINSTSLKRRGNKPLYDNASSDYVDYSVEYDPELKHNVGGIENSLIVLSKHGAPTKVERQISFELESNLSRFRKLKDYSPFEINPSELAKYYPPPSFNMTQGEARIRKAMLSNTPKHKQRKIRASRNVHGTSLGINSVNEMHNDQFIHGILKNPYSEIEHIDSYDNMYGPYNRVSTTDYTLNEEPSVPFDTPRSLLESRISSRLQERTRDTKEKVVTKDIQSGMNKHVQSDIKHISNSETQTSAVKTPQSEKENTEENKSDAVNDLNIKAVEPVSRNEKIETVDIQSVQMKTAQPQSKQIDASGRTFLTSDNMPLMGVVTS